MSQEKINSVDFSEESFDALVYAYLDGMLDQQQGHLLNSYLQSSDCVTRFVEICKSTQLVRELALGDVCAEELAAETQNSEMTDGTDSLLWQQLAEQERTAPTIVVEKPQEPIVYEKVSVEKTPYVVPKLSIYTAIISTAAFFLLLAYVYFMPQPAEEVVARIGKSVQARWAYNGHSLESGSDLRKGALELVEGYVEIVMDDGAVVLLEAPVKLNLEDTDQVFLDSGSLVANVPPRAIGFTVRTPDSTIVDYGTNFGVQVDPVGTTEAHVFKGEVEMRLGSDIRVFEKGLRLLAGQAAQVTNADIQVTHYTPEKFVSVLPTKYNQLINYLRPSVVWRKKAPTTLKKPLFDTLVPLQITRMGENVEFSEEISLLGLNGYEGAQLNGQNRLKVKIPVDIREQLNSASFTTVMWIKADQIKRCDLMSQFDHREDGTAGHLYRILSLNANGTVNYETVENDDAERRIHFCSQIQIRPSQWYHFALSGSKGKQTRLYINGQLQGSVSESTTPVELCNVTYLGGMPIWDEEAWTNGLPGQFGELLYFDRCLSDREIRSLYQSSLQDN